MKRLPLFFLIAALMHSAYANNGNHAGQRSEVLRASNNDRVNNYTRDLEAAIKNSRTRKGYDRIILATGNEEIFTAIQPQAGDSKNPYGSGDQFMRRLEEETKNLGCIPNLLTLTHGWGASRTSGGHGIPISENSENGYPVTGFYTNEEARLREVKQSVSDFMKANDATIRAKFKAVNGRSPTDADMAKVAENNFRDYDNTSRAYSVNIFDDLAYVESDGKKGVTPSLVTRINKGDIKFCNSCLIQLYSCNIHRDFINQLAAVSGCQVVYGTGKVSAKIDRSGSTPKVVLTGYKSSDKEKVNGKETGKYINLNTRDGDFVRVTPVKNGRGNASTVIEEKIGTQLKNQKGEAYGFTYTIFK